MTPGSAREAEGLPVRPALGGAGDRALEVRDHRVRSAKLRQRVSPEGCGLLARQQGGADLPRKHHVARESKLRRAAGPGSRFPLTHAPELTFQAAAPQCYTQGLEILVSFEVCGFER